MKCFQVIAALALLCAFTGALAGPATAASGSAAEKKVDTASKRALDQMIHPLTLNTGLTKGAIDTSLSVLGVAAFGLAFIVIPLLALLFTSSSSLVNNPVARSIKENYILPAAKQAHSRHARGILDNDKCIERIVCELQRGARNTQADKWADAFFNQIPNEGKFMRRVSTAYRTVVPECGAYTCEPVGFVIRLFIYVTDWNTVLKG